MKKRSRIVLPLTLLLGLMLACRLGRGGEATPTELPSGDEEITQPTAAITEDELPTAEAATGEDEDLSLASITEGLDGLESYVSHISIRYSGETDDGATEEALEMDVEFVRDPHAERVTVRTAESDGAVEFIQIGDRQYFVLGEDQCMSSSVGDEEAFSAGIPSPDEMFGGLSGAHRVLPDETVNGVLAQHYTFDKAALENASDVTWAEGEAWVAVDGGYVVRFAMRAEGKEPTTGHEGQYEIVYDLEQVNAPLDIQAPAGCDSAALEFPTMLDATDIASMGEMLMYNTSSSLDEVLAFYQEQMTAAGWTSTGEPFISEDTAMLTFSKEETTATITLTVEDGKVSVIIMSE